MADRLSLFFTSCVTSHSNSSNLCHQPEKLSKSKLTPQHDHLSYAASCAASREYCYHNSLDASIASHPNNTRFGKLLKRRPPPTGPSNTDWCYRRPSIGSCQPHDLRIDHCPDSNIRASSSAVLCGFKMAAAATAPPPAGEELSSLFENERGSDVVLLVGAEGARERIPAHSWVLCQSNDYFRTSLLGPIRDAKVKELYFAEDHPKTFRGFIRWLYGCGCSPRDTQAALDTLQVAIKYLCVDLVEHLVQHLSKTLHPDNVLQIMAWGHQYTSNSRLAPSAPPSVEEDLPPPYPGTAPPPAYEAIYDCDNDPTNSCHHLVNECFSLLDAKADLVLASEALEEVSAPLLSAVLSRDTLGVSCEVLVLEALHRWSSAECRRQHLPLTQHGRRQVLGQMLTLARLCTLKVDQLASLDKLYEQPEVAYISARVRKVEAPPTVPPIFVEYLDQMAKPRQLPSSAQTKKDKRKQLGKKKYSTKQLMWDIFSVFAHMID